MQRRSVHRELYVSVRHADLSNSKKVLTWDVFRDFRARPVLDFGNVNN